MRTPRKWLVLAALLGAGLAAGCIGVPGSGKAASEKREVGEFSEIEVSGAIRLEVVAHKARSVELSGDDNLLPLVRTDLEGKRLLLGSKQNLRPKLDLVAKVSTEDLALLRCSGACEIKATGIDGSKLTLEVSGVGDVTVQGKAADLNVELSGAGKINTEGLAASSAVVRVSGTGDVALGSLAKLDVRVSGAGNVTYQGDPSVTKQVDGVGSIRKK